MKRYVLAAAAVLWISGCSQNELDLDKEKSYKAPTKVNMKNLPNSQNDAPNVNEKNYESKNAKEISDLAETVPGVKNADVIVSGIYTLVGITPEHHLTKGKSDHLRLRVYQTIKGNEHGKNAAITTAPSLIREMRAIQRKIDAGDNLYTDDVYNKLGILIGKITPVSNQAKRNYQKDLDRTKQNNMGRQIYE
ncbi:YhcN/YlaJ family sporulation lipoprotein [Fictibacillus sp. KIGAM418]|uniref:YhcN/YlaJ family sporulation lipoprotein n=1 Tax=Fictibacillus marinisediminis TaxID=2878389 RepID=A0A9X2BFA4_9BACL|nr:YhcN/YlaJ family sporulation lipoprotein [Fictibacillus marinisediminis]MCK6257097.1 YhcN/YlaJ family sporulation lipoprotein [Fictibacillus marinisediminis]